MDLRQSLEDTLAANPDDVAAHNAYADHLTEQGDPRGEFIQVQLALEDFGRGTDERQKLMQREEELFQQHGRKWLGDLAPYLLDQKGVSDYDIKNRHHHKFRFARGWLDTLQIRDLNVEFGRAFLKAPLLRLLRVLAVDEVAYEEGAYKADADLPAGLTNPADRLLLRSPHLGNVRVLQWGELDQDDEYPTCHMDGALADELIRKMPKLEELYLLAHGIPAEAVFAVPFPHLRVLQVDHGHRYPLELLADNATLGNLTHLLCYPHALEPGDEPYIRLPQVRAVVNSPHLPSLTHLRLRLSDMGDAGAEEIVQSGILKRLKMLDLMHGRITDAGARALAASPDIRNLELLDVSFNRLTPAGIDALLALGIKVLTRDQHAADVDDEEYLYHGDIE